MAFKLVMLPPQTDITRDWAGKLRKELPDMTLVVPEDEASAAAAIEDADGAFGVMNPQLLARGKKLRWLQSPQIAPPAGYYFPELVSHQLTVTNMREIFNDRIGAHIMAFVLAFARDFQTYIPQQLRGEWKPKRDNAGVVYLPESTMLIVGVGGIGAEAARLAAPFGITVIGTDGRRETPPEGVSELHKPEALDDLLPRADFVVLTVPHTPATEGFFDAKKFARMKPSSFFINIGRGKTTKLDDLVAALESGQIAGVGLDVFEQEPLPPAHKLWKQPGVLLTPHTAGFGPYLDDRRYAILRDNCCAMMADKPLINVVDKANWF